MIVATPAALATWFRSQRKNKGFTQKQIASLTGLKPKTISEFECGKVNIRLETLFRLLAAVKLNIDLVAMPQEDIPWEKIV